MTDTMVQTYEVGDRVTATYSGQTYTGTVRHLTGSGLTVVQFDADNVPNWTYLYGGPNGERWEGSYDITTNGAIDLAKVEVPLADWERALLEAPEAPEVTTLRETVERLTKAVAYANVATQDAKRTHRQDISYMADALKTAAEENDLCNVFEQQVRNIGGGLSSLVSDSFIEEASRPQEHTYLVDFTYTGSTVVTASDEDAAREMVEQDPGSYFDRYSCDFNVDSVEEDD